MLRISIQPIDNGFVIQSQGHTLDGRQFNFHRATREEVVELLRVQVVEWFAADAEREKQATAQKDVETASQRYSAAMQLGKSRKEAIAAALDVETP